jgi:hypothetical protein
MSLPILKVVQRSIIRGDLPALIEIERTNKFRRGPRPSSAPGSSARASQSGLSV